MCIGELPLILTQHDYIAAIFTLGPLQSKDLKGRNKIYGCKWFFPHKIL